MRELEDRGERLHERVWNLLPWYVNGTLSLKERERVEAHLAACRRCLCDGARIPTGGGWSRVCSAGASTSNDLVTGRHVGRLLLSAYKEDWEAVSSYRWKHSFQISKKLSGRSPGFSLWK